MFSCDLKLPEENVRISQVTVRSSLRRPVSKLFRYKKTL